MLQLARLRLNGSGHPKGLVPWSPRAKTLGHVRRILALYEEMSAANALPMGPRQCGYRLTQLYPGEYVKQKPRGGGSGVTDFDEIGRLISRLQQSGQLPWEWVSDAASVTHLADGYRGIGHCAEIAAEGYRRDLREGQPTVVEIYAEARDSLPLIRRVAHERGVSVYSGSGSSGPGLARKTALRALARAVDHGQSTLILGLCDFDRHGITHILRPHIENVAAFLFNVESQNADGLVLAWRDDDDEPLTFDETDAEISFGHLAITPELARNIVDDGAGLQAYLNSGTDLWSRDAKLIPEKIELEALNPIELRDLVIEAVETTIDSAALRGAAAAEVLERERIRELLASVAH